VGPRIRSSRAGRLGLLVTLVLVGMMTGMTPASAATGAASLEAAIRQSPGISGPAAGYSQQAELTVAGRAPGGQFGGSVALSAGGSTALVSAPGNNSYTGAAYVFTAHGRA
jgi:hypothetical protein